MGEDDDEERSEREEGSEDRYGGDEEEGHGEEEEDGGRLASELQKLKEGRFKALEQVTLEPYERDHARSTGGIA
ncbi:hypothetical protein C8R45DRAFT_482339 [Mycena sanguinolenta]|nr:hypothetical protein C8R45DRAFT_482339 [Mycena sanguinolenta]